MPDKVDITAQWSRIIEVDAERQRARISGSRATAATPVAACVREGEARPGVHADGQVCADATRGFGRVQEAAWKIETVAWPSTASISGTLSGPRRDIPLAIVPRLVTQRRLRTGG